MVLAIEKKTNEAIEKIAFPGYISDQGQYQNDGYDSKLVQAIVIEYVVFLSVTSIEDILDPFFRQFGVGLSVILRLSLIYTLV
jgi:hypothetical protein